MLNVKKNIPDNTTFALEERIKKRIKNGTSRRSSRPGDIKQCAVVATRNHAAVFGVYHTIVDIGAFDHPR